MGQVHQAPSTKILDVQQVTPGGRRLFTVLPRGTYTFTLHNGTYSDVYDLGDWSFLQLMMDIFATSITDAGDVMDLSVQLSTDGVLFYTVGGFTQQAGNAVAAREVMTFTTEKSVNEDALFGMVGAAAVIDEKTFGRYMRVLITIVDNGSNANDAHQVGIEGYIK